MFVIITIYYIIHQQSCANTSVVSNCKHDRPVDGFRVSLSHGQAKKLTTLTRLETERKKTSSSVNQRCHESKIICVRNGKLLR
jgi:hypothetical protein